MLLFLLFCCPALFSFLLNTLFRFSSFNNRPPLSSFFCFISFSFLFFSFMLLFYSRSSFFCSLLFSFFCFSSLLSLFSVFPWFISSSFLFFFTLFLRRGESSSNVFRAKDKQHVPYAMKYVKLPHYNKPNPEKVKKNKTKKRKEVKKTTNTFLLFLLFPFLFSLFFFH